MSLFDNNDENSSNKEFLMKKNGFSLTHYLMKKRKRLLIQKSNICL